MSYFSFYPVLHDWSNKDRGMSYPVCYLTTHSIHFIYGYIGVGHMTKDHSDSERGNPLPPPGLLFPISSKGSFICIIPQTG